MHLLSIFIPISFSFSVLIILMDVYPLMSLLLLLLSFIISLFQFGLKLVQTETVL